MRPVVVFFLFYFFKFSLCVRCDTQSIWKNACFDLWWILKYYTLHTLILYSLSIEFNGFLDSCENISWFRAFSDFCFSIFTFVKNRLCSLLMFFFSTFPMHSFRFAKKKHVFNFSCNSSENRLFFTLIVHFCIFSRFLNACISGLLAWNAVLPTV